MALPSLAKLAQLGYRSVVKPILFRIDPERVHDRMLTVGKALGRTHLSSGFSPLLAKKYPLLQRNVAGLSFTSPIGLAAGFDKNADLLQVLPNLGFGFAEIGSVTKRAYAGNTGKRLTRAPELGGIFVNYGLKSAGAATVRQRILDSYSPESSFQVGVSIAPTNDGQASTIPAMVEEYVWGIEYFKECADYLTLNLSCPNTSCGQPFLQPEHLHTLLDSLPKGSLPPIFVKLSPDLTTKERYTLLDILSTAKQVRGIVLSNLTKKRESLPNSTHYTNIPGGLSGKRLFPGTLQAVAEVKQRYGDRFAVIACGGIQTADDAYAVLSAGADLIQIATGLIFNGPTSIAVLNQELAELYKQKDKSSSASH